MLNSPLKIIDSEKKFTDLPKVSLSENQKKVISEKYLRAGVSIEEWLWNVAQNIALAELFYHPSHYKWGLFNGVRVYRKEAVTPQHSVITQTRLFHSGIPSATDRDSNFHRFIENCMTIIKTEPEARELVDQWTEKFYMLMSTWQFLPNSPTLMNAGRELQQLSACYVLPVEDSVEGITHALQAQALIHKAGGGTGFSFEKVRQAGASVKSTNGVASGVVSFMKLFDSMTEVVKQGGNRRGANMGILPYWHPEIKNFIKMKSIPGSLENFNVSVSVDHSFIEAVRANKNIELKDPRSLEKVGEASAREIFNLIVENAWKSGDPGLIFTDRINDSRSNPTPSLGKILATNPCGEQPLLPNEPCNLGSINLSLMVKGNSIDWESLENTINLSVRFLDDVIDVNNYPLSEVEMLAKGNRRIGLGVMGWAEMLVKLGIPYDSDEAIILAKKLMAFINESANKASENLAADRGIFPNWKNSIYDPEGEHFSGKKQFLRHCARTTIAPTGTIGLAAGLQGAGIEPFFAIAYTRYTAQALEAIKNGISPSPRDVYFEINPLFKEIAQKNNFFGLTEKELWNKIEANDKSVRGIPEIPKEIQTLFAISHDVSVEWHVKIQAAFQEYTDNAVSKTINLPHTATIQDVENAFFLAYDHGCKGITIYRDGSKQQQVLNLTSDDKKVQKARDLSVGVSSETFEIKTGYGQLNIHIEFDHDGPFKVFASLAEAGSEMAGLAATTGVLISKYLEQGGDANKILKQLYTIRGDRPVGLGENRVNSIPHGIGVALKKHLQKHGWLREQHEETGQPVALELWKLSNSSEQCPKCFSKNISFNSGCSGPLCQDCGFSECN